VSPTQWCRLPATGAEADLARWALLALIVGTVILLARRPRLGLGALMLLPLAVLVPSLQDDAVQATAPYEGCVVPVRAEAIATLPEVAAPIASDKRLSAGGELTWAIGGFEPVESVVLILASQDRVTMELLDQETSDTRGDVVLTGVLPVNLSAGAHDLVAFAPVSGIGYRAPVTVDASGVVAPAPTTTVAVGPGAETTTVPGTSTTTTTVATSPGVSVPGPAPTSSTSTTTTLAPGAQAVAWLPRTTLYTTDSPEMPTSFALSDGPGSISYSIVNAGTTGCSVDGTTAELTYSGTGTCTVRADAAASGGRGAGSTTVTFTITTPTCGPKPSYNLGDTGPGGGIIVHEAATCQSWGWYVEVAPANWTGVADASYRPTWCDEARFINGAKGTRLGAGESNGATIATVCPEGAAIDAREYRGGGKVDWYLGSSLEWHQVCRWAHATAPSQGGGTLCISPSWGASYTNNDGFTDHYWTSTQVSGTDAIENWMPGGNDFRSVTKDTSYVSSRPVRTFGYEHVVASIVPTVRRSTSRTVDATVDFSTAISGLSASDFTNLGTASGCTFSPTASAGTSIGVRAICDGDGTLIVTLKANSVTDGTRTGPPNPANASVVPIDSIPPVVTTSARTLVKGSGIDLTVNERSVLYVVDATLAPTAPSDITSAAANRWNATPIVDAGVQRLHTAGLVDGTYRAWAVDLAGNLSAASTDAIVVRSAQACTTTCLVGDTGPGGGTVVYDAGSVQSWGRYLEVAPANWSGGPDSDYRPLWCDANTPVADATATAIGTGRVNSEAILALCPEGAAVDAREYRGGGKVDWYLGSSLEWHQVCRWAHATAPSQGGGTLCISPSWGASYTNNDGFTDHYWTSTQVSGTDAIENWMPGGNDFRSVTKDTSYVSSRPVRTFGGLAPPDASIVPAVRYSTSRTIDFTVDFSTAISGLLGSDFSNIGTASGCTYTPTASAGTSIGVQVVCSSDGTVITRLAANAVTDGVLTGPVSPVNGPAVPVDSILPTVTLTETGALTFVEGTAIGGTLDERGTLYLAAATISVTTASDITSAADADWNSIVVGTPGTIGNLNTKGLNPGSYTIYGVDLAGNVNPVGATTLTVRAAQNCTTNCLIGDTGPGGGIVVYDAGSVQSWGRYLEVAPASWRGVADADYRPIWCNTPGSVSGATNSAIGTGATNTAAMVAGCSSGAAVDIAAYAGGGLTDWFLPSEDEQRTVCRYAHANYRGASGCGGTWSYVNNPGFTDHYWTSTQISATVAIQTWMPGANDYRQVDPATSYVSARPMRAF
jgi:hypothetical protein